MAGSSSRTAARGGKSRRWALPARTIPSRGQADRAHPVEDQVHGVRRDAATTGQQVVEQSHGFHGVERTGQRAYPPGATCWQPAGERRPVPATRHRRRRPHIRPGPHCRPDRADRSEGFRRRGRRFAGPRDRNKVRSMSRLSSFCTDERSPSGDGSVRQAATWGPGAGPGRGARGPVRPIPPTTWAGDGWRTPWPTQRPTWTCPRPPASSIR